MQTCLTLASGIIIFSIEIMCVGPSPLKVNIISLVHYQFVGSEIILNTWVYLNNVASFTSDINISNTS